MVVISTVAASTLTTTSDSLKMRAYDSADWSLHQLIQRSSPSNMEPTTSSKGHHPWSMDDGGFARSPRLCRSFGYASRRFISSPTSRVASPCLPCPIFFLTSSSLPLRLVISFEQLSTGITPSVGPPPLESGRDGTPRRMAMHRANSQPTSNPPCWDVEWDVEDPTRTVAGFPGAAVTHHLPVYPATGVWRLASAPPQRTRFGGTNQHARLARRGWPCR